MKISAEQVIFSMDAKNPPVAKVDSGSRVTFETLDCFSNTVKSEKDLVSGIDFSKVNPATGPLYINGALAGDILKVTIEAIRISDTGVVVTAPGLGQLADHIREEETLICQVVDGAVEYKGIRIPLRKMIGVIGTAPEGEGINTGTPAQHGGNMDTTRIAEGAIVYLPVNVEGALLAMGDLHAVMGDGEIMGSGLEVPGQVDVKVEVLKNEKLPLPFVETAEHYICIASDPNLEVASKKAIENMATFISERTPLSLNQAGMFLSLAGNLVASQVVNPNRTMRLEVAKDLLEQIMF